MKLTLLPVFPSVWLKQFLLIAGVVAVATSAVAVERTLKVTAPASVKSGAEFTVMLSASTDAGGGEQIGFLQADVSLDGGKTWTGICYLDKSGPKATKQLNLKAGAAGTPVKLRARAAFRDGAAGDVDYTGAAIRWPDSWDKWEMPPSKQVDIPVNAR